MLYIKHHKVVLRLMVKNHRCTVIIKQRFIYGIWLKVFILLLDKSK